MLRPSFSNSGVNQVLLCHLLHLHVPPPRLLERSMTHQPTTVTPVTWVTPTLLVRQSTIRTKVTPGPKGTMGTKVARARNLCRVSSYLSKHRMMKLCTTSTVAMKPWMTSLHCLTQRPVPAPPDCVPSSRRSRPARNG